MTDLDALTAYHYDQGGDQFHAMQYKVHRYLVKGLLRRLCDRMDQPPAPLDRYLDQSCESYCAQSRSALKGKAGVFELELLHRLDLGSADPLPGLLQVTEN